MRKGKGDVKVEFVGYIDLSGNSSNPDKVDLVEDQMKTRDELIVVPVSRNDSKKKVEEKISPEKERKSGPREDIKTHIMKKQQELKSQQVNSN